MSRTSLGWTFVAVQVVLLVTLVVLPTGADWPWPRWLSVASTALVVLGLVVGAWASLTLGRALTPTPVPNGHGELRTDGLYGYVRHPIYTGVLLIVVGLTLGTRQWWGLVVGLVTVGFFWVKARWEEARLAEVYPGYRDFAAVTPRFVPLARRRSGRPSGPTASGQSRSR